MAYTSQPGTVVVDIFGPEDTGTYKYNSETIESIGEACELIAEGVGFDWFYDSLDFSSPGRYLIKGITVTAYPGDYWTDADEDIEVESIERVPNNFSLEG